MKKKILRWLLLAAIGILSFEGCSLLPVSVEDRIAIFLEDINSLDRSSIYLNFHPDLTGDYDFIRNETYPDWGALFPTGPGTYIPYSISSLDTSDPMGVTGTVESVNIGWVDKPIFFIMAKDGMDWMIQEMQFDGTTVN